MGEKSGVVGKVVHYYWIIESAKKWIMECVNEHEVSCKAPFHGVLRLFSFSIALRIALFLINFSVIDSCVLVAGIICNAL